MPARIEHTLKAEGAIAGMKNRPVALSIPIVAAASATQSKKGDMMRVI